VSFKWHGPGFSSIFSNGVMAIWNISKIEIKFSNYANTEGHNSWLQFFKDDESM